jgi:hypothetical protein
VPPPASNTTPAASYLPGLSVPSNNISSAHLNTAAAAPPPNVPGPATANAAEVKYFASHYSPSLITSNAILASFFANPHLNTQLKDAEATLHDVLGRMEHAQPHHIAEHMRACKLVLDFKTQPWFDWKLLAADPNIRAWRDDMMQLHGYLGRHEGLSFAGPGSQVEVLKNQIWEVNKVLLNGGVKPMARLRRP